MESVFCLILCGFSTGPYHKSRYPCPFERTGVRKAKGRRKRQNRNPPDLASEQLPMKTEYAVISAFSFCPLPSALCLSPGAIMFRGACLALFSLPYPQRKAFLPCSARPHLSAMLRDGARKNSRLPQRMHIPATGTAARETALSRRTGAGRIVPGRRIGTALLLRSRTVDQWALVWHREDRCHTS